MKSLRPINVGLLGIGTVGGGTFEVLTRNQEEITRRAGRGIVIRTVADKDLKRARKLVGKAARVTDDAFKVVSDPDIDIVYVAGIHPVHREHAVMMLEAGKHVLVEKPLAMSPSEVESIIEASRSSGRFMMEAMWMRFNPLHVELKTRIDSGEFGPVEFIESDFTFEVPRDPSHRLFDPAKGGGALLDVGIYPLNLAWWWLGEPDAWSADGTLGPTGVDESVRMELEWRDGAKALLTCGSTAPGPRTSTITCRSAVIRIDAPSHASPTATIESDRKSVV